MFCSNCGNEILENEKYCSQCGKPLVQDETDREKKNVKNNTPLLIGICCGVAVLIIGIFALGILFGRGDGDASKITDALADVSSQTEATTEKQSETTKKPVTTTKSAAKTTDSKGIVNPDESVMGGVFYVNPKEGLYLRKGPGKGYADIALLKQGDAVMESGYSSSSSGWMFVRLLDGSAYGWVSSEYLSTYNPAKGGIYEYYRYADSIETVVLEKEGLNLRTGASRSSTRLGTIPYMRSVKVIGYSAYDIDWVYVSVYLDGRTQYGFVDGSYLQH